MFALAATSFLCMTLGFSYANDTTSVTIIGDNIFLNSTNLGQTKFIVGELLLGDMSSITQTSTSVATPATPPTVSLDDLSNLLSNETDASGDTITTVWQTMTGLVLTGVDDISFNLAYKRARTYGITTLAPSSSRMDHQVLRYEFAIMMENYIQNVENKNITHKVECDITYYGDYKYMSASVKTVVQLACDAGLMGRKSHVGNTQTVIDLLPIFRPFDVLSTAEMNIVFNRYVPSTVRLFPTSNTRADVVRFLYSISPRQ